MPAGIGKGHVAEPLPRCPLVCRNEDIHAPVRIQLREKPRKRGASPGGILQQVRRKQPLPGGKHRRLVEHHSVPDATGFGPFGIISIGVLADRRPQPRTPVSISAAIRLHNLIFVRPHLFWRHCGETCLGAFSTRQRGKQQHDAKVDRYCRTSPRRHSRWIIHRQILPYIAGVVVFGAPNMRVSPKVVK